MFAGFCFSIMFHSLAFLLGMFVLAQHLPWRSYSGHSYKCHCVVAAVTVPKQTNKQTNKNHGITTRAVQNMIILKRFWLDVWSTKRNTDTHTHILQYHVCLKLKIIKMFPSGVGSLNKTSLKQQETLKQVSAIPYLLSTTIPWSQSSPKRQRFPKNGRIALLPKGHVFSLCDFHGSFSFFTLSYLFTIVIACHCHIHNDKMISKMILQVFLQKTKARPFWTFFNNTELMSLVSSWWVAVVKSSAHVPTWLRKPPDKPIKNRSVLWILDTVFCWGECKGVEKQWFLLKIDKWWLQVRWNQIFAASHSRT